MFSPHKCDLQSGDLIDDQKSRAFLIESLHNIEIMSVFCGDTATCLSRYYLKMGKITRRTIASPSFSSEYIMEMRELRPESESSLLIVDYVGWFDLYSLIILKDEKGFYFYDIILGDYWLDYYSLVSKDAKLEHELLF